MNLLNAMRVFVRIVDEGSLAAAATASNLSSTMVGNYLRSLEEHMGMTLLTRTTRRQSLTEFGKVYYGRCVEILELIDDTNTLALQSQAEPKGRLRVSSPHAFGIDWLMPALGDYARQHPQVDIDLIINDRAVDLVNDEFEATIRIGPILDDDVIARPLASYQAVLCAAPRYLAARGEPHQPSDLAEHDCLLYTYATQVQARAINQRWSLTGPEGVFDISVPGRIHVNNPAALRRAALDGIGIALLPDRVVADDLKSGALVAVLASHPPPSRPVHLIYRRDQRISPKLRSFIDFVIERFASKP